MIAEIEISGLDKAEKGAREIIEHIETIRKLAGEMRMRGVDITIKLESEATSDN